MELINPPSMPMEMDEALVLYRDAGILKKSMADISDSPDTYISAAKIEVGHCRSEVPDALYDSIVPSTSARDYQNVTTTSEVDVHDLTSPSNMPQLYCSMPKGENGSNAGACLASSPRCWQHVSG